MNELVLQLRLDSVRKDAVGYIATFYGKPDVHGNAITVPITAEQAAYLTVGEQIRFLAVAEDEFDGHDWSEHA